MDLQEKYRKTNYDFLIVGAGLSGAVLAERLASILNKKVLIIDKRDHIGGNCFDFIDENQILMNQYGAHLFHTNDESVWGYINMFAKWVRWDHKVLGKVGNKLVNIPVNINTVNSLLSENIQNSEEMDQWLSSVQVAYDTITNSEEVAKSRVGEVLYEKMFKNYTYKQWAKYPSELDKSVLERIPVRNNHDERYFSDKYQVLPEKGYTDFISSVISHENIDVCTSVDFFEVKDSLLYDQLIYTGPIDRYFESCGYEKLEYRSIDFKVDHLKNMNYFQVNSVVNYPENDVDFTRIVEYKHFLNQVSPHTTIVTEFTTDHGDPYYPVPNERNSTLYNQYVELTKQEENVHFIGRLANYKYFNMDQAIKNALEYFDTHFLIK
jgi:UDP-galactopyranose mutase